MTFEDFPLDTRGRDLWTGEQEGNVQLLLTTLGRERGS